MTPRFTKYQALGNDYLVLDRGPEEAELAPETIRAICDRNRGPGSDGILIGGRDGRGAHRLRIFNPDGSEAEKSGNGIRIYARHLYESRPEAGAEFPLETLGGRVLVSILHPDGSLVRVDMGEPHFERSALGLVSAGPGQSESIIDEKVEFGGKRCRMTCVSMGNPHSVLRGLPVDASTARRIGPLVENASRFPQRTNVQFLEILSREEIRIEIWERGAGYTLSSGSSSCAAAAAARRLGLVGDSVRVNMPGGALDIELGSGRALMTGPVEKVYEGRFSPEFIRRWSLGC